MNERGVQQEGCPLANAEHMQELIDLMNEDH